jgi:hypothetical protein
MNDERRTTSPKLYEHYQEHWACFHCRKMFKRPSWQTLRQQARDAHKTYPDYLKHGKAKCPDCSQAMQNMGKGFRPPKQKDVRQWKSLQKIASTGARFSGWRW